MKFIISKEIFDKVDDMFVGVVVAKGIDNSKKYPKISKMLDESIKIAEKNFLDKKVKEDPLIIPYRDAFLALGINPNKYQCSVEAMFTRISKGKQLPHINPLVDLNNAISLKYTLPMGTHDLSRSDKDVELRFANEKDTFVFFPIDGFKGFNDDKVMEAAKELEKVLKEEFKCETVSGYVDKDNREFEWNI